MANDIDFIALYRDLGIEPGCAMDEFRRAYRRRVAQLHPDRQPLPSGCMPELQHLNALYTAAMQFHLQHGRLPGSARPPMPRAAAEPARRDEPQPPAPRRHPLRWTLVVIALAVAAIYWSLDDDPAEQEHTSSMSEVAVGKAAVTPEPPRQIQLGMRVTEVLAIQGEPVSRNDTLWEFGPSWISFECGSVSDWYSSRIRPLKVAVREPSLAERERLARMSARCRGAMLPPTIPSTP